MKHSTELSQKLRVAMVSVHTSPLAAPGHSSAGGMNIYVRELARHLGRHDVSVDVFTRSEDANGDACVQTDENCRVISLAVGPPTSLPKRDLFELLPEFALRLARWQEDQRLGYDIVHSHYWLSGWVGREAARTWDVPHVTMFHTVAAAKSSSWPGDEGDWPGRPAIENQIVAYADAVVVASHHERALLNHMSPPSNGRVHVIPCGVDLDFFRPVNRILAKETIELAGQRVVLFVGRVVPLKGVDILVDAVSRMASMPDVQLIIAGGEGEFGHEMKRLQWLVGELDLEARVRFEGHIERDLLPTYYSAADVCVVPSHYESFGLVALESLACGTPVIASKVGGLTSIVRDRKNGLLVPWRCPQEFADRISETLTDTSLMSEMRSHARASVEHLSWDKISRQILELYSSLVRGGLTTCRT